MDWVILIILLVLLLVSSSTVEGFSLPNSPNSSQSSQKECPTRLFREDGQLRMVHQGKQVKFENLQEYTYFVQAMRTRGIRCPVLYVEPIHDAQGGISIKQPDDPITPTPGLMKYPAGLVVKGESTMTQYVGKNDPVASVQMPIGYDPANQIQGQDLPIDRFFRVGASVNPYSAEWAGPKATERAIKAGEMKGDEVSFYH